MHPITVSQAAIFSLLFHASNGMRRIVDGIKITEPKRYVVYLAKSRISPKEYDAWICGGAIVSTEYIVTSAACVEDVRHMYAIAGYSTYVSDEEIYTNPCTSRMKKKIVFTCVPKSYEFNYEKVEKWSFIDIAIAKVESPFDFYDKTYEQICSYIPRAIQVNYENKYQEVDIDAIALGWGHAEIWRLPNDTKNYNQNDLHYAPILIADKEECKKHYTAYEQMLKVIDKYMICSMVEGNINERGELNVKSLPAADGCTPKQQKLLGFEYRFRNNTNQTVFDYWNSRKHGICQNDHGGPIVTWIGSHEVLIGVASVFKVSKDMRCIGPFLYTSTQCNGAFLDCLLLSDDSKTELSRKAFCDSSPEVKGFETVKTYISWREHPDGPSENERH